MCECTKTKSKVNTFSLVLVLLIAKLLVLVLVLVMKEDSYIFSFSLVYQKSNAVLKVFLILVLIYQNNTSYKIVLDCVCMQCPCLFSH